MKEKITDKFYEIIDKYDEYGNTKGAVCDIKDFMDEFDIKSYEINVDNDVYDNPGLDIYYIMLAWNDEDGLHLLGSTLTRI